MVSNRYEKKSANITMNLSIFMVIMDCLMEITATFSFLFFLVSSCIISNSIFNISCNTPHLQKLIHTGLSPFCFNTTIMAPTLMSPHHGNQPPTPNSFSLSPSLSLSDAAWRGGKHNPFFSFFNISKHIINKRRGVQP